MSVYNFRDGPSYTAATREEMFTAAMDMPMNFGATFWDQAKGGTLESFGLGTAIRGAAIPPGDTSQLSTMDQIGRTAQSVMPGGVVATIGGAIRRLTDEPSPVLSEDAYKASPFFRDDVPWDASMTEDRAAALASWHDAKAVRQYFATKRPITAFLGNVAGQAADPINYIPVVGPAVQAAAAAKAGRVLGTAATASADAALNTAIAGMATSGQRAQFGDDVSWQAMITEIATAALIGAGFGGIVGGIDARRVAGVDAAVRERLSTLQTAQEARIALNEGIDALAKGEDINLSPNATAGVDRVAAQTSRVVELTPETFKRQPYGTVDDIYAVAPVRQSELDDIARGISQDLGVEYKTPGIKDRAGAEQKIARKGYADASGLTDVVRGGFVVSVPKLADDIIARLAAHFDVMDEGWVRTSAGYVDRKALVRFDDGMVAEIQMWEPALLAAKDERGHALYERYRALDDANSPEAYALEEQMRRLYGEALAKADQSWSSIGGFSRPNLLNRSRQSASSISPAVYQTSRRSTSTQGDPGLSMASALDAPSTAGRSSQLTNFMGGSNSSRLIDNSTGAPIPPPDGVVDATAAVGKPDAMRDLAKQHGVDLATGDFIEMADIDAMRARGRLSAEDEAALAAADETFENAQAYGNTIKAALHCLL